MENKNKDPLQRARDYAFLLLKFRLRSEKELWDRLKKKGFDNLVVKETLVFLKDKKFIDDNQFSLGWIESRLRKPLGLRKIRQELKIKGINTEVINKHFDSLKEDYSEENTVLKVVKEKFNKLKGIEPQKAKRRLYAYFLRRGFSPEVVIEVMKRL